MTGGAARFELNTGGGSVFGFELLPILKIDIAVGFPSFFEDSRQFTAVCWNANSKNSLKIIKSRPFVDTN
jgi:hypothetical protein